ncbi:MAG: hypothetical protein M1826_000477 [Phylliscum demangeonii]|nr:MAG: hypothetical protein M1826_000477 [Phylliscum demangeonii]
MWSPAAFLLACMLANGGGGGGSGVWALPAATPPDSTPQPPQGNRIPPSGVFLGRNLRDRGYSDPVEPWDMEHLFPAGQVSSLSPVWSRTASTDPIIERAVKQDGSLLPNFLAYQYAATTARHRILYAMHRDEWFMRCVFQEMAKPVPARTDDTWNFRDAELFFAGVVCQEVGRRPFGIRFPRVNEYFKTLFESGQWSEEAVQARVRARRRPESESESESASNGFQFVPHQLRALSRSFARLGAAAWRVESAAERAPLVNAVGVDGRRALVWESHL